MNKITTYGVGCIGKGEYKIRDGKKFTIQYIHWRHMLYRCYGEDYQEKHESYEQCSVCDEWLCYQNFGKWFDENYYEIEGERMELDKDILFKGNKIYSSKTCVFVPQRINCLFVKRQNKRGQYPIGVTKQTGRSKKFKARCSITNKKGNTERIHLGNHDTPIEAFQVYKEFKEKYIKQVAEEYKDKIPQRLYDAMYNWQVEITD